MTNANSIVLTVLLWTNSVDLVHPSSDLKVVQKITYAQHRLEYAWEGQRFLVTTNIPLATNVVRMTWQVEKADPRIPRMPLNLRDKIQDRQLSK